MTSAVRTPFGVVASTIICTHLIPVQLSLWTLLTIPMHKLVAAKGGVVGINASCSIALIVPFTQQLMTCCFKCGLLSFPSRSFVATKRTSAVILHTSCNLTLPLMAADRALPVSSETTASKRLIRRLGIFVLIPVSCLSWCLDSKRVVLADFLPFTTWAFTAS